MRDHPVNDQDRNEFARTQGDLGALFNLIGKLDLAEAASRRAMAIREALVCEHPGSETYRHALAQDYHNLGNHELTAGRLARAESAYRTAMVLREALAREYPGNEAYQSTLSDVQNNLGITLQRAGNYDAAAAAHRAALAILEVLVRDRPARTTYKYNLSNTHNDLGTLNQLTGRHGEAETSFRLAAEMLRVLTRDHPDVLDYALDLGACELNLGRNENDRHRPQAALDWLAKAIPKLEEVYRREPRAGYAQDFLFNEAYVARARALAQLGRYDKALDDWDRAIAVELTPKPGWKALERAFTLAHLGRHMEAIAVAEAANAVNLGTSDPEVWFHLARLYSACSAGLRSGAGPAESSRLRKADEYAARAGACIERSHRAGYFRNSVFIKNLQAPDPMLNPLRSRPEFQALVGDLAFPVDPFAR